MIKSARSNLKAHLPQLLLALFIIAYAAYFSWYTINRHNTLNSYTADLSLIDQPMWNTVRGPGGFMELTWGDRQQPRLAEHFEPVLLPLALLFSLWDNVRVLLIAQSLALALGALPVFLDRPRAVFATGAGASPPRVARCRVGRPGLRGGLSAFAPPASRQHRRFSRRPVCGRAPAFCLLVRHPKTVALDVALGHRRYVGQRNPAPPHGNAGPVADF